MDVEQLRTLLEGVRDGSSSVDDAFARLRDIPFANLGFAHVDHHRALRQGLPEIIFGEPKSVEQVAAIAAELVRVHQNVVITRLAQEKFDALRTMIPEIAYHPIARIATIQVSPIPERAGRIAVVTGGTGDMPVAEEAVEMLRMTGLTAQRLYDIGVAGIHRVLSCRDTLMQADALIVVAGMEGALASVVGGLASCPVIAVPTSIGYGAQLAGFTPLLSMLSSCASGVVVVNIDNGFGAAMAVHRILLRAAHAKETA